MLFDDRERAEEALFAHHNEMDFQAHVRRNKLFGLWAATQRGLAGKAAQDYATSLALEDFPHYRASAVLDRVTHDFADAGVAANALDLSIALATSADRAQCEVWHGASQARA